VTLILDENLPPRWRDFLATFNIQAIHWLDIGNPGDSDETLFDYASSHGAIIISQDLDFTRMLALRGDRLPSIIQLRVDSPVPEVIGQALLGVLHHHRQQLKDGCLISLELNRHRLRLLPLH
jgi:predicted nuclease of predicted toxin-antitoxin system